MNTDMLNKFWKGEPLFHHIPFSPHPTVMGFETELGCAFKEPQPDNSIMVAVDDNTFRDENGQKYFPQWLENGGRIYVDGPTHHLEVCTPEVANAIEAVVQVRACLEIIRRKLPVDYKQDEVNWYSHNYDGHNHTFGGHESYATSLPQAEWLKLAPFLVARTIFVGLGEVDESNNFFLSQRAIHITHLISGDTMNSRGLLCSRPYDKEKGDKQYRLHLICGESNLNQAALFLKFAFTSLLIRLLELKALPKISYLDSEIISDLHNLSRSSIGWIREDVAETDSVWSLSSLAERMTAVEVINTVIQRGREVLLGQYPDLDLFIDLAPELLEKFAFPRKYFYHLVRICDWAAKLSLCLEYRDDAERDQCQDFTHLGLEYHRLGAGLQRALEEENYAARIVSDALIQEGISKAPVQTRASLRGWLVKAIRCRTLANLDMDKTSKKWSLISVARKSPLQGSPEYSLFPIPNPSDNYRSFRRQIVNLSRYGSDD